MSLFSRLGESVFFTKITPLLRLGSQRSLQVEDLPELPEILDPEARVLKEENIVWDRGSAILISLLKVSKAIWFPALGFFLVHAVMSLAGPVLVNRFVTLLSGELATTESFVIATLYAVGIGAVGIIGGVAIQHYFLNYLKWNQIVTNVVNKKIFTHSLALKKEAREATPVGDIVNHLGTDTDTIAEFGGGVADLIHSIVMICGAIGLLFYYLGHTAWVAVVLLGILAPLTKKVSRDFSHFDDELMKWRDKRVTLMSQILSAIRLVKHFGWEKSVAGEVGSLRRGELDARERLARAELLVKLLYVAVGTFVLFAVFAVHSWRGGVFDAALIFTCVSLFGLLEDPFGNFSRVISMMIAAKVGGDRVSQFLKLPTVDGTTGEIGAGELPETELAPVGFKFGGVEVPAGSSIAVVGGVGSGKSTFIHALLGENSGFFQDLELEPCRIGFVSQEAFILNGTLRENLTFGRKDVSDEEIDRAIDVACFAADIRLMPGGLLTEIGEKGINLSGGQRQRLSLARAVIHRPQLVVLDDPLSAVDSATEARLVERLLAGPGAIWNGVTRVMITHRLSHLDVFDQIGYLENGKFKAVGKFDDLKANSLEFRSYLEEYGRSQAHGEFDVKDTAMPIADLGGQETRVTDDEDRQLGAVAGGVYWQYIRTLGGSSEGRRRINLVLLVLAAMSLTLFPLAQKSWLAFVANTQAAVQSGAGVTGWWQKLAAEPMASIYVYGAIGLVVMIGALVADLFWLRRGLDAGRLIHESMLQSVLGSRIRFFDSTPVGRTLQRFSRDLESIDIHLRWAFEHSLKCLVQVLVTLGLIVTVLPMVLIAFVPILYVYYRIQNTYRVSSREVKRLDSIARSPRFAHFKETLQGLVVIRAYGKSQWFLEEFYRRLRHGQRMFFGNYMINRWFSSRIPVVGGLVSISTTVAIVIATKYGQITPGVAGLVTIYSLSFWGVLNWGIRVWADVEARMTSMERVRHYLTLPQEDSIVREGVVPEVWPTRGEVKFEAVKARYAEGRPMILKGVDFTVPGGSRAGLIGRTGSGKTTTFQALYRFIELAEGRILIDGVDIAAVPLAKLRRALAIIPQDPTLFIGTIRMNLDRYNEHSDEKLWDVLDRTSLGGFVRSLPGGLTTELAENGVNLSQGQRQLLCLARALLMNAKVILLDEATASVDVKTDATVQRVLRDTCQGVTMLMIAHRLGTTRDCDIVVELKDGVVNRTLKGPFGKKQATIETTSPASVLETT